MRLALVPRTTEFYDLFTRAGENMLETARLVERRFAEFPADTVRQSEVKALESKGDELAKSIDDVVDYMDNASDLLGLYKVESRLDASLEQCKVLVEGSEHLSSAL